MTETDNKDEDPLEKNYAEYSLKWHYCNNCSIHFQRRSLDITDKNEEELDVCTSVECLWNQPPR